MRKKELQIKKEVTPKEMSCMLSAYPAIFETNNNSYLVVGKVVQAKDHDISERISKDETLIEVPKELIDKKL